VVQLDTGSTIIPKKSTREPTAVRNEVLSSINNALCLESYEYENQTVKVHNARLSKSVCSNADLLFLKIAGGGSCLKVNK
jgi:hypothetical protein